MSGCCTYNYAGVECVHRCAPLDVFAEESFGPCPLYVWDSQHMSNHATSLWFEHYYNVHRLEHGSNMVRAWFDIEHTSELKAVPVNAFN